MGKQERDEFIAKNDLDVLRIKKAFFVIVYIGMFIILLSIVNTLYVSLARAKINSVMYPKTSSIIAYNYSFYQDTLYESYSPSLTSDNNSYIETTYELPYNATYTFTGETGGVISGWTEDETGGSIHYDTYLNGHDYIVHLDDNGAGTPKLYQDFASDQTSGTIAFWMLNVDATTLVNARFYENGYGGTMPFRMSIQTEQLRFFDGASWISIGGALDNIWYHTNIDFDTTIDEVNVSINGVRVLTDQSVVDVANVGGIAFLTTYTESADLYLDAIDYSWDSNYSSFRSLYGITNYTGISQTAFWDFSHTADGNYTESMETVPFWSELESGSSEVYVESSKVISKTYYITDGLTGIYHTFDINNAFINVSWYEKFDYVDEHADGYQYWYGLSVFSDSLNLLTQINVTYQALTYTLSYYNGTNDVDLTTLQNNTYYYFNLYIDGSVCILRFNHSNIFYFSTIGYSSGLGKVSFTQQQQKDNMGYLGTLRSIDYIGVYANGTSLSDDFRSWLIYLNVSSIIPHKYPYIDISMSGNYSLSLVTSEVSEFIRETDLYNNTLETIYIWDYGDDYAPSVPIPNNYYTGLNPYFAIANYTSINITSIKIYSGILLTDGSSDYFSEIYYSNLTENDITFTTIDGSLYFNATFNETSNQQTTFIFSINPFFTDDNVIVTSGGVNDSAGFCELNLQYDIDGMTNNFTFSSVYNSATTQLHNNHYLEQFFIFITDNPNDNLNKSIGGYLNNFVIYYVKLYTPPIVNIPTTWVSLIIIVVCVFPIPIIIHIRIKKRYPNEKHEMLQYLIPAIIGCVITTALYFGDLTIMPLFVYITLFVGFFLLILPSMLNRYLTLGLMFVALMVYGGYFPSWVYIINLLIVSFTTILAVKNMNLGDK